MAVSAKPAPKGRIAKAGTLYLVHVLTHSTRARLDGMLAEFGLSSFQYTILSVIDRNEGLSSARLSRRFHVTPQAMGEVILLLEKRGLIARTEDAKNRKVLHLSLTDLGQDTLHKAEAVVARFEQKVFAMRTPEELQTFRDFLSETLATVREKH